MKVNGGVPVFADVGEMKRNVRMAMMKQRYNVHELWKQYPPGKNLFLSPLRIVKLMIFLPWSWKLQSVEMRGFEGLAWFSVQNGHVPLSWFEKEYFFFSIRGCAMNEALGDLWEGLDGLDLLGSGMLVVNSLPDWPKKNTAKHELCILFSWESKGTPPMPPPPGNKALLRDY